MPKSSYQAKFNLRLALVATAGFLLAGTGGAQAATAKAPGLTGLWLLDQRTYDGQEQMRPPLKPEAQKLATDRRKAREDGGVVLSDNGKKCLPIGMPGLVTNEFALEFLETPGKVTVVSENSPLVRSIYLNLKAHPADLDPSWNGHSIGHWEGKTLVVDTIGLNDRISHLPAGGGGMPSLSTHIIERYHLEKGGQTLVNVMTFEDPKVLTGPWTVTYHYHRAEKGAGLWEYVCEVDSAGWSERYAGDPEFKKQTP